MNRLDLLLAGSEALPIRGWDLSALQSRWLRGRPPWDLRGLLLPLVRSAASFLDLGTGGGEFLASLAPLPSLTVATEGYPPNLPVAQARLGPLGVRVIPVGEDERLDLPSRSADLVLARHEAFDPCEVARVLRPGGTLVTQQVGPLNYEELHRRFGVPPALPVNRLGSLAEFGREIEEAGLELSLLREARYPEAFLDVGAVVYLLRAAPWEVPGFSVSGFRPVLEAIHAEIGQRGRWELEAHRFLAVASRPR